MAMTPKKQEIPIPEDEESRLGALAGFNILDTVPEECFDRLTYLAAKIFDVPIALVTLIDQDRQWFKSHHGLEADQTPRDQAFCAHAIMSDQVLIVPDTYGDTRFRDNPLVNGTPFIRFYAGAPLVTLLGFRIGSLCLIDRKPRPEGLSPRQVEILTGLAATVMYEIECCGPPRG